MIIVERNQSTWLGWRRHVRGRQGVRFHLPLYYLVKSVYGLTTNKSSKLCITDPRSWESIESLHKGPVKNTKKYVHVMTSFYEMQSDTWSKIENTDHYMDAETHMSSWWTVHTGFSEPWQCSSNCYCIKFHSIGSVTRHLIAFLLLCGQMGSGLAKVFQFHISQVLHDIWYVSKFVENK